MRGPWDWEELRVKELMHNTENTFLRNVENIFVRNLLNILYKVFFATAIVQHRQLEVILVGNQPDTQFPL